MKERAKIVELVYKRGILILEDGVLKQVEKTLYICERCGKEWFPKNEVVRICAYCKSAYWDTPKIVSGENTGNICNSKQDKP